MSKILSFEQEFTRRYPKRVQILRFMREAIGVDEVSWDDITPYNMKTVHDHIARQVTANSASVYFAIIKAMVNQYSDKVYFKADSVTSVLKSKKTPSQNVFLTEEEIWKIEDYLDAMLKENTDTHRSVKDVLNAFIIECYCGARGIDVDGLTEQNIVDGHIVYISKKTGVLSKVPIRKGLEKRLAYKSAKKYGNSTKDRVIKRVCKAVGITEKVTLMYHGKLQTLPKYECVGFHTARRSFCTNLARRGVDIYTIAALANHDRNIAMTQRYIVSGTENLSPEAMAFFKR